MSEFSLIYRHFANATNRHTSTVIGIGDDCAVSQIPANHQLVSCVDTLVAGRHFPIDSTPYAIGYKSVAVNLSDLASMGASPFAILLALSLPKSLACDEFVGSFAQGMADICTKFGVELIGGDSTQSDVLTITITALGTCQKQPIRRNGAMVGDMICVSGEIGSASLALKQCLAGQKSPWRHHLDYPMPQVALGQKLVGFANSMIDVSDGLGQDLQHILNASGVGAKLYLDKIPCMDALRQLDNDDKWQHMLNGGDDYQLCLTISPQNFEAFTKQYGRIIHPVGQIIAQQDLQLYHDGHLVDFAIHGWVHFDD